MKIDVLHTVIKTMNDEKERNNPGSLGHQYNEICSCGTCHMGFKIASAIIDHVVEVLGGIEEKQCSYCGGLDSTYYASCSTDCDDYNDLITDIITMFKESK